MGGGPPIPALFPPWGAVVELRHKQTLTLTPHKNLVKIFLNIPHEGDHTPQDFSKGVSKV